MKMRNRNTLSEGKHDADGEVGASGNKRHYNKKAVMCRLCLRMLPKEDLPEIFAPSGNTHRAIQAAVSIQVNYVVFPLLPVIQILDLPGAEERSIDSDLSLLSGYNLLDKRLP